MTFRSGFGVLTAPAGVVDASSLPVLDSNQDLRVQSPPSYRLDEPEVIR